MTWRDFDCGSPFVGLCGLLVLIIPSPLAAGEVSSNGTGMTMELRVCAGGGLAYSGPSEMVNVVAGPASPLATTGNGYTISPFLPDTSSHVYAWRGYDGPHLQP